MAFAMRMSALSAHRGVAAAVRQAAARPLLPAGVLSQSRLGMATRATRPVVAAAEVEEEEDVFLEGMTTAEKRRVMALRAVQAKYDALNAEYQRERATLEAKYMKKYNPVFDERHGIVSGATAVGAFDLPDDGAKDEGLREFWLTALANHEAVGNAITERDAEVLKHLTDVRCEVLPDGPEVGFRLIFSFEANPHFTDKALAKTYFMENMEELIPSRFEGSPIAWAAGKDTTVQVVKKKVQDKKLKGKAPAVAVSRTEPCDSFFNFFSPPPMPENPADLSDEQLDELQARLDEDWEMGIAIKEQVLPRAVEWFTGEAVPPEYDDEFDGEYEDEDEEQ